jgi:hypothetical protein
MSMMSTDHPSSEPEPARPDPITAADLYRRRRTKNLAVVAAIFGLCALFYLITIVRML